MGLLRAIGWAALGLLAAAVHADPAVDPRLGNGLSVRARPTLGSDEAPLVVIEFSSFQCPHCLEFRNDTFPGLDQQYIKTGKVQWVVINAASDADVAREPVFAIGKCLSRQGRFEAFAALLYNHGNEPQDQILRLIDEHGGFDAGVLKTCLTDPATAQAIAADFADYQKLKVTGTPTFILRKKRESGAWSGARIVGNLPLDYFQHTFDTMLKLP